MSLIHDSLRKLEDNQSKDLGLDANYDGIKTDSGFNAKKLWMIVVVVVGIGLIIYAYLMMARYQQQNEMLLNDMKQFNTANVSTQAKVEPILTQPIEVVTTQSQKSVKPLIVQPPIKMQEPVESQSYASLLAKVKQQDQALLESKQRNANADFILKNNENKITQKPSPIVAKTRKIKNKQSNKLSIKQTRQLVNNLQIQIESKNTQEVESLLAKLAVSSGDNSIVYLRMNAYWSTTINDDVTATSMYKKILFQKPQDIQANTNLALLEAKNNKVDEAINRLKVLRIEHPTDKTIVAYLEKIERMHDK